MQCCVFCCFYSPRFFPFICFGISKEVLASGESLTRVPAYFNSLLSLLFFGSLFPWAYCIDQKDIIILLRPLACMYLYPFVFILHVQFLKRFCCIQRHAFEATDTFKRLAEKISTQRERQRRPMNRNVYCRMLHDDACFSIQFKRWFGYSFPAIIDKQIQTS